MEILHVEKTSFVEFGDEVATVLPVITVIPPPAEYAESSALTFSSNAINSSSQFFSAFLSNKLDRDILVNVRVTQRTNAPVGNLIDQFDTSFTIPANTLLFSFTMLHSFPRYSAGNSFYSASCLSIVPASPVGVTTVNF